MKASSHTYVFLYLLFGLGFLVCAFMAYVFLHGSEELPSGRELLGGATVLSEMVALLFWTTLVLLAGYLWQRALYRARSLEIAFVFALPLSAAVILLSVFAAPYLAGPVVTYEPVALVYALVALFGFLFIGFLCMIAREIIVTALS